MQYPVPDPFNGVASYFFPYKVNHKLFKTWFPLTYFSSLTGEDMTKPVYKHTFRAGEGLNYAIGKLNPLDYMNPAKDTAQKRGFAQTQSVESFSVNTTRLSWPVECRDLDLMSQGTPIEDLPSMVSGQLGDIQQKNFSYSLLKAATTGLYPQGAGLVNGIMPVTNRAVAGNLIDGQVDGAYVYNGAATMQAQLLAAMPNARATQHRLTLKHLRRLKIMAELGGNSLGLEDPIRPSRVTMVNGQDSTEYFFFAPPGAITNLLSDAEFQSQMVTRIHVEAQPQPISGADYIGKIYGINIYECPMLDQFRVDVAGAGDGLGYWSLLIGAGAWTVGWYKYPHIVMDRDVIENKVLFCSHEQRGQDVIRFQSNVTPARTAEQGIIHSFTRV